jgi:hypothetical protein
MLIAGNSLSSLSGLGAWAPNPERFFENNSGHKHLDPTERGGCDE